MYNTNLYIHNDAYVPAMNLVGIAKEPVRRLGGSTTATVMVVNKLDLPEQQFVVKAMALRGMDEQERRRALQEVKILKSLTHECIIEYIDFWWVGAGVDSARITFVMECGENGDLRVPVQAASQSGRYIEEVLILSWLQQMLRGLEYVHQKDIIHRDLKAMNIFLKDTWRTCKLGDFGISTAVETGKSASGCVGTPAYMAPELLWNQRYASAVDLWAIGVVLYELMALRLPFIGSNVLSLVYQIAFNNYDEAPLGMGGYSPSLIELVARFMDKDPAKRPDAAHLLAEGGLWETFSCEAAKLSATTSFNQSMSQSMSKSFSAGSVVEARHDATDTPGINAEQTRFPELATGTGSSWGEAIAILGSMASDAGSIYLAEQPIPAALVTAETLGSVVSNTKLWEELLRTRQDSDQISMDRFEDLLKSIGTNAPAAPPPPPPPPPPQEKPQGEAEAVARAAENAASAASLQRMAAEISLESHGYQAVRRLGGSTTATVMVVHKLGLPEQQFVVKAMALRGMDEQERRRALQEVKILKSLTHECIIEYIDFWWVGAGVDSARITFVMECGENGDLRVPVQAASQSGRYIEEVLILSWLQQMLRGLEYVHQKDIIHRDLKAMNIFLKDTWRTCKLGDFGISTAVETGKSASGCVGTPAYMAPELLWNQRYASAVDLWAIGVVLYELMALRLPFIGSNVLSLVYQIAFNNYDEAPLGMGGYSPSLIELVARFMDKDPAKRPDAAHLLAEGGLWETFSCEAAKLSATTSFNQSMSQSMSKSFSAGSVVEARHDATDTPGINAEQTRFPEPATGTGSSCDMLRGMSLDSISGEPQDKSAVVATETLGSWVSSRGCGLELAFQR